jgi:hypothetical protein
MLTSRSKHVLPRYTRLLTGAVTLGSLALGCTYEKQPVETENVDPSPSTTSSSNTASSSSSTSSTRTTTTTPGDAGQTKPSTTQDAGDPSDAGELLNADAALADGGSASDAAVADGAITQEGPLDAARPAFPLTPDGAIDTESCEYRCDQVGGICQRGNNEDPADDKCVIECDTGDCSEAIMCPEELHCEVSCARGACDGLIKCADGKDCSITCDGNASCSGGVDCSNSINCAIECSGSNSCEGRLRGGATRSPAQGKNLVKTASNAIPTVAT